MQQALALDTPPAAPRTPTATTAKVRRLWFCVYLPNLSLEASGDSKEARVVVEEQHGIHRVLLACPKASAAGILPGQSANAALALLPELHIEERSALREQQAIEGLATWLEQFTSLICITGRDVLLLEIAGSLRLYGGLLSLRRQVAAGLTQQGFGASLAIAPTPLSATWLARAGRRACIREPSNIASVLRDLPRACLDWPATICESINGMGVTSVGDCLRLPREGFARRFGTQRLLELDRALGRLPDPRASWRAPERFCADYEMTEEQSDREALLAICHELFVSLERFLLTRQLGTQRLCLSFFICRLRQHNSCWAVRSSNVAPIIGRTCCGYASKVWHYPNPSLRYGCRVAATRRCRRYPDDWPCRARAMGKGGVIQCHNLPSDWQRGSATSPCKAW